MARFTWLMAAVFVVLAGACSDSDNEPGATIAPTTASTVTATSAPTATPTPEPAIQLLGLRVVDLRFAEPTPLPMNAILYLIGACHSCDAAPYALMRAYREANGNVAVEDLYRLDGAGPLSPVVDEQHLISAAVDPRHSSIAVTICEFGDCGGVGAPNESARSRFISSSDGGVTWIEGRTAEGAAYLLTNSAAGSGVASGSFRQVRAPGSIGGEVRYLDYPSQNAQSIDLHGQAPGTALVLPFLPGWLLVRAADGVTLYHAERTLNPTPAFDFSRLPSGSEVFDIRFARTNADLMVTWSHQGRVFSGFIGPPIGEERDFTEIYRWPAGAWPSLYGSGDLFLDGRTLVATVSRSGDPAPMVVDFAAGEVREIEELAELSGEVFLGVRAASAEPFAKVRDVPGATCAEARVRANTTAGVSDCPAAGVLVRLNGEMTDASGKGWALVSFSGHWHLWMEAAALEYADAPSLNAHPAGIRTGNPDIDPVIELLETTDVVPYEMVAWQDRQCGVGPDDVYIQPCPEGITAGATIGAIRLANCEGGYHFQDPAASSLGISVGGPEWGLHSIAEADPDWFGGDYALVYVQRDDPRWASVVYVEEGKVAGRWAGCTQLPGQVVERAGSVMVGPP